MRNGRRSPRRPPVIVPSSAPTPKPSDASGTNFSGNPARVVSSGHFTAENQLGAWLEAHLEDIAQQLADTNGRHP